MEIVKKVIGGVEYQAAWRGINFSENVMARCVADGRISHKKLSDIIFSEVIISPEISVDDFEDAYDFLQVYEFGKSVLEGSFEENISKGRLSEKAKEHWSCWRLIFCDMANFTYDEVFNKMTPMQIREANAALDIANEELKKITKKH